MLIPIQYGGTPGSSFSDVITIGDSILIGSSNVEKEVRVEATSLIINPEPSDQNPNVTASLDPVTTLDLGTSYADRYVALFAEIGEYYVYDNTGSFEGSQSFSAISTYVFDADGELDFFGNSYLQGFDNDSELVFLKGSVDPSNVRIISFGESFDPNVRDWDTISFVDLDSNVNIDLSSLDPNYFEATATNNFGQSLQYWGAEGVIGSRF